MKRSDAVLLLGGAVAGYPLAASGQGLTMLKAAGVPEEAVTSVLWAEQSGLFRRYGLDVDLQPQRSGTAIAAGVAGGAYQIGKSSIVPLITAHAKGIPFIIVAPGGLYRSAKPHIALLVRADSPIKTAVDMNGRTLGVSALEDLYTIGIKNWMDKNGGNSTTLKIVELPLSAIEGGLETGRIDAGGSVMPALQSSLDSGKVRILAHMFDAVAPEFMYTAWFTATDYLKNNRKTVAAFARAESQAAAYVNGHPQQTIDMLSKYTAIEPGVIARMTRASLGTTLDPKLLQPCVDMCAKYKVIASAFDARDMLANGLT
ncbi:MAG TPA: ABC transporter substrate-binding protein [Candidatus Binatia bacterium]|nr:ABC transporter substrate-binding protein [Candidatus Binatia bacterium]